MNTKTLETKMIIFSVIVGLSAIMGLCIVGLLVNYIPESIAAIIGAVCATIPIGHIMLWAVYSPTEYSWE